MYGAPSFTVHIWFGQKKYIGKGDIKERDVSPSKKKKGRNVRKGANFIHLDYRRDVEER